MGARAYSDRRSTVTLNGDDVRRLLRHWGCLHASAAEPAERKRRLILGLCDLLRAHAGMSVVTLLNPDSGHPEVVSVVRATVNNKALSPAPWHDARGSPDPPVMPRGGHPIQASMPLQPNPTLVASLTLVRGARGGSSTAHAVAVLELVHEEARWLYAADPPLASPSVRRLPDRQRHVLQYLMAGESEQDVARYLGIDVRTVRSEGKAAYRSLGAADREALLTRWAAPQ